MPVEKKLALSVPKNMGQRGLYKTGAGTACRARTGFVEAARILGGHPFSRLRRFRVEPNGLDPAKVPFRLC